MGPWASLEDDGGRAPGQGADHVQLLPLEDAGPESQALRAVVVPGHHDDGHAEAENEVGEGLVEQGHRLGRRHGPVEDVAGHEHGLDARPLGEVDDLPQEDPLVFEQVGPVERPPQVPVGGVREPHGLPLRARHVLTRRLILMRQAYHAAPSLGDGGAGRPRRPVRWRRPGADRSGEGPLEERPWHALFGVLAVGPAAGLWYVLLGGIRLGSV